MAGPLKRVLMRSANNAMRGADPARWHYGAGFDAARAADQHAALAALVSASGATVEWVEDDEDGLADSVFTHDPSLMTDQGAVILRMGKPLRSPEPDLHARTYAALGIPELGRIEAPGTVEGGDCVWLDRNTLAVGRGVRTNQEGIQQLANLLGRVGVSVFGYDLPLWHGEEACLHLMSVISPLADDCALVFSPLLPAPLWQELRRRGIRLVEGDADEFHASVGLSLNVLAVAPMKAIAVAGFPRTKAAMEAAGCAVETFEADALCIPCEGGPTCLTRPILRG
ncbi:MAG: amidinotransferase [Rhizobiaceae bacterium]|nr:amidinotransferase [Rhizobiaceae bacterium]MCV0406603.1 amidinotransferase [Rhizobiaceae bacterium]